MHHQIVTAVGKTVQRIARLRSGGSALPGLVVEKIDNNFLARTLSQIPHGVVVISGTNGKTTTTKIVVKLLEDQGLSVFTNRTGSNFTRGVTAALFDYIDSKGNLSSDIAVLELDEAHAVHFVKKVAPKYCLLLNVMRDQLDRFGEIDKTAKLLQTIAMHTTEEIVFNADDPHFSDEFFVGIESSSRGFGVSNDLLEKFPSDQDLYSQNSTNLKSKPKDVTLVSLEDGLAKFEFEGSNHETQLLLRGAYNALNAAGAISLVRAICGDKLDVKMMLSSLSEVEPAFGRGEAIEVNGRMVELILVKNPSGFRLSLSSFSPDNCLTAIAINDNYADGRDMSWLWDVGFESLRQHGVSLVTGIRAYDMALRLQYDLVEVQSVETSISTALQDLLSKDIDRPIRIYCTYTAMLNIRRVISKMTNLEKVL